MADLFIACGFPLKSIDLPAQHKIILLTAANIAISSQNNFMEQQNYTNHRRMSAPYHYVTAPLVIIAFFMAIINLAHSIGTPGWLYTGILPMLLVMCILMTFTIVRMFSNKVQDLAIRAEENLRVYVLTGKPIDPTSLWARQ